ncbi:hypothetical protein TARUN_7390 [Trichoderma arundinaceum]|uniref:Uncharacterized protein n=1 Tax=Trichoderma arundinaceum TaxID=490622 RepID=A0A395NFT5_TRIAR|nr:hypothetical protein TARUN_7390 [Trichoderma arundinaceum]
MIIGCIVVERGGWCSRWWPYGQIEEKKGTNPPLLLRPEEGQSIDQSQSGPQKERQQRRILALGIVLISLATVPGAHSHVMRRRSGSHRPQQLLLTLHPHLHKPEPSERASARDWRLLEAPAQSPCPTNRAESGETETAVATPKPEDGLSHDGAFQRLAGSRPLSAKRPAACSLPSACDPDKPSRSTSALQYGAKVLRTCRYDMPKAPDPVPAAPRHGPWHGPTRRRNEKKIAIKAWAEAGSSLRPIHARYRAQRQIPCGLFAHLLAISMARFPAPGAQFPPIQKLPSDFQTDSHRGEQEKEPQRRDSVFPRLGTQYLRWRAPRGLTRTS